MSSGERTYLDWNATAPLRPEARAAMLGALDLPGNASSIHAEGRAARALIERCRDEVATLVGAQPEQVVFTSGGTEANALALAPGVRSRTNGPCKRLLVGSMEHASVRLGHRFSPEMMHSIPAKASGLIDVHALSALLDGSDAEGGAPALVSVGHANSETGVVQPIREIADLVHSRGGLLHVDAVQSAGRISCLIDELGADLLTLSAHKLGGPKGAGALVIRKGVQLGQALLRGGVQERGARAGTENIAAIAGFGAAAKVARERLGVVAAQMEALRSKLETGLRALTPEVTIFGVDARRLPNTTLFAVPGIKAETAVIALDLEGFAVSSGSACSSGKVEPSHVLAAMGVEPALATGAIRVSLGYLSTEPDIDRLLRGWRMVLERLAKGVTVLAA